MKFLKTHYGRAINVIPSDTVNIPNPAGLGTTGTISEVDFDRLKDDSANFTTNLLGAIVVNTTNGTVANVVGFVNSGTLILDADIFPTVGQEYSIYNSDNNQGCAIYTPAGTDGIGTLKVLTVGGDILTFQNCGGTHASSILPVNVLRVFSTGTQLNNLIALW
jgi:hypothetical protein